MVFTWKLFFTALLLAVLTFQMQPDFYFFYFPPLPPGLLLGLVGSTMNPLLLATIFSPFYFPLFFFSRIGQSN